ncbi:uncharacterized protein LOC103934500 isoform X3 [Pyrus x bretschneideri]|uniref:uncharacterized protein LOC103934500 isoform X3 n=1 Tax=Pyrus x bretschneideri TaxID=225117 RepID=UPI0020309C75|nr:uncharacterized protein LOC103934500 isoform X3 [Pyrus x bretschneideri]
MAAVNTSDSDKDNHVGMKGISKGISKGSFMQALILGTVDGCCSLPASYSSFELLSQTLEEVDQHCSLDILPILLEKAPLQARLGCPFHSSHATDVYSISMLATESNRLPCASVFGFLNFSEVSSSSKGQMCMDAQLSCQNYNDLQANRADSHPPCIIEIDLEKGYIQAPELKEEAVESLKREGLLAASLKVGGKLLQLLFNHGTSRDNAVTERIHEAPNNRWKRCKRTTSFDSRKVVIFFSILSSLGTMILIYLTLRVRQNADGFFHDTF